MFDDAFRKIGWFYSGDLLQFLHVFDIDRGGSRRLQIHRIGDDGSQQQTGKLLAELDFIGQEHAGDDRSGCTDRHGRDADRVFGFKIAETVMVDDFQNDSVFDVVNGLFLFIVIYQDQLFLLVIEQVVTGDRAYDLAFPIQYRIGSVTGFGDLLAGFIDRIVDVEIVDLFLADHDVFDRRCLINKSCDEQRRELRRDDRRFRISCHLQDMLGDRG